MVERICENCMSRVPVNADKCPKCGIRFENTNPGGALPNGWVLGERYTVGRYISIDGEGVTYSAIDGNTLQRVSIKEYMPVTLCAARDETGSIVSKPGCEVLFKTTRMDYKEMYDILMRMGLAEGLVQTLDVLEANNTVYAVLEKIEGPTLAEYLMKTEGAMETNRALAMLRPVMVGMEALHTASLVHRGICPENIILESGGTAKLAGYGTLALRQQGSELKPKLYPGYSAPEQYAASEFEGRYTDIYAFGAVLYRMVTGVEPIPADERKIQDTLRPARSTNKEVPVLLSNTLSLAMRMIPAERIQNMPDLRLALSGEGGRSAKGPLGLSKQQLIVGASALAAVVVLLLVVVFISLFGGKDKKPASSAISSSSQSMINDMRVPNFVGRLYADVIKSSDYKGYTFLPPKEEFSADIEVGKVISQTPEAGIEWDETDSIQLVVSKGPEKVELPNLVGQTRDKAAGILTGMGIEFTEVPMTNKGDLTKDEVVKTDPEAGKEIVPGKDKVTLYVASDVATIPLPNLAGRTRDEAVKELEKLGFKYNEETVSNDGTATAGRVASSSPGSGEQVAPGSTVTIRVYGKFLMPDLSSFVEGSSHDLQQWLNDRKIPWKMGDGVENDGGHTEGNVARIDQPPVNSEITSSSIVVIHNYGPPRKPEPPSEETTE